MLRVSSAGDMYQERFSGFCSKPASYWVNRLQGSIAVNLDGLHVSKLAADRTCQRPGRQVVWRLSHAFDICADPDLVLQEKIMDISEAESHTAQQYPQHSSIQRTALCNAS